MTTAPHVPAGFPGFVFEGALDGATIWALAHVSAADRDEVSTMRRYVPTYPEVWAVWINGAWVSLQTMGADGGAWADSLADAAEAHCRAEWEDALERAAEDAARQGEIWETLA